MPTDLIGTVTRNKPVENSFRAVILESNERIIFRKARGGYALLLTWELCRHHHKTPERAFLCREAKAEIDKLLERQNA